MSKKILVACEFSGVVRDAFAACGHDAWSNDLLPADGNHLQMDCMDAIGMGWDLIIMHPPCTALCVSGNRWYGGGMPKHQERVEALEWTQRLWETATEACDRVCMENPVGVLPFGPHQYVNPWEFGHEESKKTGLWLHGLPPLMATEIVSKREQKIWKLPPTPDRWALRSITYPGIAKAMAEQWGE